MKAVGYIVSNRTSCLILSLFTKVSLAFSCTLPKVACFQSFLLTHCVFCGNLSQQFNITYLHRVPARLPKEPEQVFNFLSLHNEPEPRPSRKGWSGSGCCVAIFLLPNPAPHLENRMTVCMGYTAMTPQGRAGKRRWKGAGNPRRENGNCHPLTSCVQNEHMRRNGRLSTRWGRRNQCGQNVYIDSVRITPNLDLTFCQATVKSAGLRKPQITTQP